MVLTVVRPNKYSVSISVGECGANVRKRTVIRLTDIFKVVKAVDEFMTNNFRQLKKILINTLKRKLVAG